ncbi:hypothetical protein C8R46DRAFT_1209674 [Mycena filopes]|nr:hypothetical protein C8R46DRAFT_1209674 [Mycena filopes]
MPNVTSLSLSPTPNPLRSLQSDRIMPLPIELVECIIDASSFLHRSALGACSLVCRQWLPRSRHLLFSSLDLSADWAPEPNSVTEFFKIIDNPHSTVIPYVTSVVLSKRTWGMTSVHKLLTDLGRSGIRPRALQITCPTYEPTHRPVFAASLVSLTLHLHMNTPMETLVAHVCAFPLLEMLSIGGSARSTTALAPSGSLPPRLHTLVISNPIFAEWILTLDPVPTQLSTIILRDLRLPYQWAAAARYLASPAARAIRSLTLDNPPDPSPPLDLSNLHELRVLTIEHYALAPTLHAILPALRAGACPALENLVVYTWFPVPSGLLAELDAALTGNEVEYA